MLKEYVLAVSVGRIFHALKKCYWNTVPVCTGVLRYGSWQHVCHTLQ